MLLYGAGGHAKVIIDCLLSQQEQVSGIFDDDESIHHLMGIEVHNYYSEIVHTEDEIILAIGDNQTRKKLAGKISHSPGTVAHASAVISERATIGDGTVVFQHAVVQSGSAIGGHVIINTSASVDHDCAIGDFVHIAPGAILCGNVSVGEGTLIGAGTVIIPGINIGKWATIGAGSVITKDVPDNAMVVGNPSRVVRVDE
jgi:sugar O-acyltransferase (sialic acid O-acetyltransferase NeuD family)